MYLAGNMGTAVKNVLPLSVELRIYYMHYIVRKLYLLLPVLSRHFGHLVGARLVLFSSSCSLPYSGKVNEAFPFTPSGYAMGLENVVWGIFTPPLQKVIGKYIQMFGNCNQLIW